ncbi:MAG TPA: hypothetical protein VHE81_09505 [Lacipirellulaceae bacterium]|nr:hypothetical protein [Lacipirellulaceae bacterium]
MVDFVIIELPDGLTVVELQAGQSPEDAAASQGGVLVDAGPYRSYDDAWDALLDLQYEDEENQG